MSLDMLGSPTARLARKVVRMCFVVLFGTMSVAHFPVMAFGGDPHAVHAHQASQAAAHSHHNAYDRVPPAGPVPCDGFACLLAIEPVPIAGRWPGAILFGILRFTPADFVLNAAARPDPPPPRL